MKVPLLILATLCALTLLSGCPRPPESGTPEEQPQESEATAEVEAEPLVLPNAAEIPPMLGLFAFTDDFHVDNHLRLQIPAGPDMAALRAHVATIPGRALLPDETLKQWTLDAAAVEQLFPTRIGMVIDCASASWRFQGRLVGYELWQDTTCSADYLLAVIDAPEDEQINEPAIWIGTAHLPEVPVLELNESLQIHEPPPAPPNIVGFYEKTDLLMHDIVVAAMPATDPATAAAPPATPDATTDPVTGEPITTSPDPAIPVPIMDVRFGRFAAGQTDPSAMLLGSWMRDTFSVRRALVVVDGEGTELWRVSPEALDRFALIGLQVEFLIDLDGDNIDELIVTGNTPAGATQTMLWSLGGETLTVMGEATWWGCETRIPELIEEPQSMEELNADQPPLEFAE